MLGLPIGNQPLPHHSIIISGFELTLVIGAVARLPDQRKLIYAVDIRIDGHEVAVVRIEMCHSNVERVRIIHWHSPASYVRANSNFFRFYRIVATGKLANIWKDDVARPNEYMIVDNPRCH